MDEADLMKFIVSYHQAIVKITLDNQWVIKNGVKWCGWEQFHSICMQHNWLQSSYSLGYVFHSCCQYARYVSHFVLHIKVATEYRGSASYICEYNLTIRTLICINLKCYHTTWEPPQSHTYNIHVLCSRCAQISVNHFKSNPESIQSF